MTSARHGDGRRWQDASISGVLLDAIVEPALGRITLYGELDLASRQLLIDALDSVSGFHSREVTVDMAGVSFIDATGIGALVSGSSGLKARGDTLRIVNPTVRTQRIFGLCGLSAMLHPDAVSPRNVAVCSSGGSASTRESVAGTDHGARC